MSRWYDNPEWFQARVVWPSDRTSGLDRRFDRTDEDGPAQPAWRFSVVARDPRPSQMPGDDEEIRYGLTSEAGKLNLNVASADQLRTLFAAVIAADEDRSIDELVEALIDWRDPDDNAGENGAEAEYYESLSVPRRAKNGPLDTVEELLLVKGFTGAIVFGEDYNRNGRLDPNEDDGEESFPPDNGDGTLQRGLWPYVTVWSAQINRAVDRKPRINLLDRDAKRLERDLSEYFDDRAIRYILQNRQKTVRRLGGGRRGGRRGGGQRNRTVPAITSPADLVGGNSPIGVDDLPLLMDRTTTAPVPVLMGLIDINTAPAEVLATLPDLSAEQIEAIVTTRSRLTDEARQTVAWPVTQQTLSLETFKKLVGGQPGGFITVGSSRYSVEVIGYADHVGRFCRLQAVIEMRGRLGQIVYWRDLSELGIGYAVRADSEESIRTRRSRS